MKTKDLWILVALIFSCIMISENRIQANEALKEGNSLDSTSISHRAIRAVKKETIESYNKVGAVYIPQVLSEKELNWLLNGIEANLSQLSSRAKIASRESDTGLFIEDFCTWQENIYYQQLIFESPLAQIVSLLTESQTVRLYHDHLLVKEPFTQQITPWHQDLPYYNIEGTQNCSIWIPLDPVSRESTLEFVEGSHMGPWYLPRSFMDDQAKWFAEGSLQELPSDESLRNNHEIVGWEMQPGDIVVFNMLTIHGSQGVPKNQRRRVFSVRFMGDDATFAPRSWITSPEFPGLNGQLQAGAKMEHPLFPIAYENPGVDSN